MKQTVALINKIQNNIIFAIRLCKSDVSADIKLKAVLHLVIGPLLIVTGFPVLLWGVLLVFPAGFGIIPEERAIFTMVTGTMMKLVGILLVFAIK